MYYAEVVPYLHTDDVAIHEGHVVSYYVWLELGGGGGGGVLSQVTTSTISVYCTTHHLMCKEEGRRVDKIHNIHLHLLGWMRCLTHLSYFVGCMYQLPVDCYHHYQHCSPGHQHQAG